MKHNLLLFISYWNLFLILGLTYEYHSLSNGIFGSFAPASVYAYMVTMYFWVPISFYKAWKTWEKPYWLAFWINILVVILAFPVCGIFPICLIV